MQTESIDAAIVQAVKAYEVAIHTETAAWQLLEKETFGEQWDNLYSACPWATVFQSRPYVTTWYRIYRESCFPVVVTQFEGQRLTGLLTLTRKEHGMLTGAGESQAEYQVWLATEVNANTFIKKALAKLNEHWPNVKLLLKYIPGSTPVKWVEEDAVLHKRCVLNEVPQPLLRIDATHLTKELQKKNRKEKLNRLKRIGDTRLERITDVAAFASVLDELALQYDFRKIVMHNRTFFHNDPLRKKFLLSLFEQGLLHTTVLKVNDEIIASNAGVVDKGWVHLQGLNTHTPSFSRYSPGILHFLLMGKLMAEEGLAVFDLTPGFEPYKDQLATEYTTAYVLHFGSPYNHVVKKVQRALVEQVKKVMQGKDAKPNALLDSKKRIGRLKDKVKHIVKQPPSFIFKHMVSEIRKEPPEKQYVIELNTLMPREDEMAVNKNSIRDLLSYEARNTMKTKWVFLEEAMQRFELGQVLYSFNKNGRLLGCVWLKEQQGTSIPVLQGFYRSPLGQGRWPAFLRAVIKTVAAKQPSGQVYAQLQEVTLCRALEAMGFKETDKINLSLNNK